MVTTRGGCSWHLVGGGQVQLHILLCAGWPPPQDSPIHGVSRAWLRKPPGADRLTCLQVDSSGFSHAHGALRLAPGLSTQVLPPYVHPHTHALQTLMASG